jgi:hypothetical protein
MINIYRNNGGLYMYVIGSPLDQNTNACIKLCIIYVRVLICPKYYTGRREYMY